MSQLLEYIKMAIDNIRANKGRSFLTMLGIIIGISSVIMIMSVGAGVKGQMSKELNDMAGGQLYIQQDYSKEGVGFDKPIITEGDLEAIADKVQDIKGITPVLNESGRVIGARGEFDANMTMGNVDAQYQSKEKMISGKYFTEEDVLLGRKVAVIGKNDAKKLFGSVDIVGMEIEVVINNITQDVTIVGVRDASDDGIMIQYGQDSVSLDMPYTVLSSFDQNVDGFNTLLIFSGENADTKKIADKSMKILEARHQSQGDELFILQDFNDQLEQINGTLNVMTTFISMVAGISLLVGGIGVMNIMLVSVTERTREIGIRKALGAKTGSIMAQFLMESAFITALGGIIGILLGIAGAFAICSLPIIGTAPGIKFSTILIATVFSSFVGVFFGIYPARKAAKMSPIEALRRD